MANSSLTAAAPAQPRECRIHERQPCELPTSCQPTSAWGRRDARWTATIRDVSVGGIGLVVPRRFEPGAGLAIELPGGEGQDAYVVLAKVMRVTAHKGGSWLLGCKFISELSDEELERLRPPVEPAAPPEPEPIAPSRVAQAEPAGKHLADVHIYLEIRPDWVIPCLIKRLNVPPTWPLAPGATLTMRGGAAKGPLPELRFVVIGCARRPNGWHVRGRLVEAPTDELLRALGRSV